VGAWDLERKREKGEKLAKIMTEVTIQWQSDLSQALYLTISKSLSGFSD